MSVPAITSPASPWIRLLTETRPEAATFPCPRVRPLDQPTLPGTLTEAAGPPDPSGVRQTLISPPGAVKPAAHLRDPREWAAMLSIAVLQALTGQRPVSQLDRWLDDEVLAAIGFAARRRARRRQPDRGQSDRGQPDRGQPDRAQPNPGHPVRQAAVVSVRVQCPAPTVAEAAAHLKLGRRSVAMALRLEAFGDRWLCTAVELGPRTT